MLGLSVPDRSQAPVPAYSSSTDVVDISATGASATLARMERGSSSRSCFPSSCTALGDQNLATGTVHVIGRTSDTTLPVTSSSHLGLGIATRDQMELEESSASSAQNGSPHQTVTSGEY